MTARAAEAAQAPPPPLDEVQVRVLGSLVEKAATTPDQYPLTVNALVNACNQKSSRDPVMAVTAQQVEAALLGLRDLRLARPVREHGARVTRFRHAAGEVLDLDTAGLAVVAVLALRGPQTAGELRTRTGRLHEFASTDDVADVLLGLERVGMVAELPRGPGQKETRWAHLLEGPLDDVAVAAAAGTLDAVVADFLAGARAVRDAIDQPAVAAAWDRPSALEHQAVSSLAGHLARGGVWVVGDYLDAEPATGPARWESAAAYYADLAGRLGEAEHRGIRDRGAQVGAAGHAGVVHQLRAAVGDLATRLPTVPPDRLVTVYAGGTIRLADYLETRMVEQAVHLDDLGRSVDGLAVEVPDAVADRALAVGARILAARSGPLQALRTLYRRGHAGTLPVL